MCYSDINSRLSVFFFAILHFTVFKSHIVFKSSSATFITEVRVFKKHLLSGCGIVGSENVDHTCTQTLSGFDSVRTPPKLYQLAALSTTNYSPATRYSIVGAVHFNLLNFYASFFGQLNSWSSAKF